MKLMKNSIATKITLLTGAAVISCSAIACGIYYFQYTRELDKNLFERLSNGINIIRNIAELNNIHTMNTQESKNTDYYRKTPLAELPLFDDLMIAFAKWTIMGFSSSGLLS